ncbi:MAG TPA: DUF2339 domain-containing protein, partial [Stellaceae bacterium]|nr:DUF2339 domain-containing protein [Stellaceae bacterium]
MEAFLLLLGLLLLLALIGVPVLLVVFLRERGRTNRLFAELGHRIAALEGGHVAPRPAPVAAPTPEPEPELEATPPPVQRTTAPPPPPIAQPAPAAARESLESRVMQRWAVWLGGVALALGAVFLVKYSIEQGWFGPE